jgi:uncharacterized protein YbcI
MREARRTAPGSLAAEISREMVQLLSRYMGRGPTKARTTLDTNVVAVVLEDTLTRAERNLVDAGELEAVLFMRRTCQSMMRDEAVAKIEELTDRKVVAFLGDLDAKNNIAVQAFVLEARPEPASGPAPEEAVEPG